MSNLSINDKEDRKFRETPNGHAIATTSDNFALKVTDNGSIIYVAQAKVGTLESSPNWQAKKIDTTSGVIITWADGDDKFTHIATDLTSLSYS